MNIADFFVNIGVKGAELATKSLSNVKEGLGSIGESSLAAKAGIAAVIYGLERLSMLSANTGMELQKFANFTGMDTTMLQKWQVALRQTGVDAEETAATLKGIQSAIGQMQLGKGPPGGIGIIAQYTGGFDRGKINDMYYVMDKLKQFAQNKQVPVAFANEFLKSFGLTENAIQGLRSMKMSLEDVKPSRVFTPAEIARLAQTKVAWENLWAEVKMFGVRMGSGFGTEGVKGLMDAFHLIQTLTTEFMRLTQTFPLLKAAAVGTAIAISAAFSPLMTLMAGVIFALSEVQKLKDGKKTISGQFLDKTEKAVTQAGGYLTGNTVMKDLGELFNKMMPGGDKQATSAAPEKSILGGAVPQSSRSPLSVVPPMAASVMSKEGMTEAVRPNLTSIPGGKEKNQNVNITQNITHNGDASDTQGVKDTHKLGVLNAYRQLQSQSQGN